MIGSAQLEKVLAEPLKDGPRYRYSRVVDEQDPELGRFIIKQLALATADYGSTKRDPATVVRLRQASDEILARRGAEWAGALGFLAREIRWERGFVDHVSLDARLFVEQGEFLFRAHPVLAVRLEKVDEVPLDRLLSSPVLPRLQALDLSGARLGDEGVMQLAHGQALSNLRWLSLYDNRVGLRGASALARSESLTGLRYLAFGKNYVQITPRAYGNLGDGRPHGYRISPEGQSLLERYGDRPWLVPSAWRRFPPEPYDVYLELGLYKPADKGIL